MRKLRINENNSNCNSVQVAEQLSERKLRVQNPEVLKKADRLLALKAELAKKEQEAKILKNEISSLQSEILSYGRENQLESLISDFAIVQFQSRTSRKIDPKSFLLFLADHGKTKDFYDYVDVPITNAIKHFGEAVLLSSGVIRASSKEYSGIKISARN